MVKETGTATAAATAAFAEDAATATVSAAAVAVALVPALADHPTTESSNSSHTEASYSHHT